jgi:hypothetical protein
MRQRGSARFQGESWLSDLPAEDMVGSDPDVAAEDMVGSDPDVAAEDTVGSDPDRGCRGHGGV